MRSLARSLSLALAAGLAGAATAQAALTNAIFTPTPFTKAQVGAGNAVQVTINWLPGIFSPTTPADHHDITATDLDGGGGTSATAASTATSTVLLLTNGRRYNVQIASCQKAGLCTSPPGSIDWVDTNAVTRIDATPPSGTVQINGGAVATNRPSVVLNLAATDPLINGIAGSSSGVTQQAVDADGNGTFPCVPFLGGDLSGCAGPFAPSVPATLPTGDGVKTVGVKFGDGARAIPTPCPQGQFCLALLGSPILGNESPVVTDTIILDTAKPLAVPTPVVFAVARGGSAVFDATSSTDQNPGIGSGVDLPVSSWDFKDGTSPVVGERVTHTFTQVGTFVGEVRVRDRAGNESRFRQFSVTVNPRPGDTASGAGIVGAVTGGPGVAQFKIDGVRVNARYRRSRLAGTITLRGSSAQAGALRAELRRRTGGRPVRLAANVAVGPFNVTLKLPAALLPGTYPLAVSGPGGSLKSSLRLVAPREGVLRSSRVRLPGGRPLATFLLANLPAKGLRGRLTVAWSQGGRALGTVSVPSRRTIRANPPAGAALTSGKVRAVLRAGNIVVGVALR